MKIIVHFLLPLFVFISCNNGGKKKYVSVQNELSISDTSKPTEKETIDSFSKVASNILCSEKQVIVYSEYIFIFCKDSVKNIIKVGFPHNFKSNSLDTAILLCRQIPFSLVDTKTKKRIKAIHYLHRESSGNGSKSLCLENFIEKDNSRTCIMWGNWIN